MEPSRLHAGDTWVWSRGVADYSAGGTATLVYSFNSKDQRFEVANTGTETGTDFDMSVSAAATAKFKPGSYKWVCFVVDGAERYFVAEGFVDVRPNLLDGNPFDVRTHARKVLDAIEAVIERRATKDQESYTLEGVSLVRTPVDKLIMLRDRYAGMVQSEETAAKLAAGLRVNPRHVYTRFNRG